MPVPVSVYAGKEPENRKIWAAFRWQFACMRICADMGSLYRYALDRRRGPLHYEPDAPDASLCKCEAGRSKQWEVERAGPIVTGMRNCQGGVRGLAGKRKVEG